jgi:hypothetical protein
MDYPGVCADTVECVGIDYHHSLRGKGQFFCATEYVAATFCGVQEFDILMPVRCGLSRNAFKPWVIDEGKSRVEDYVGLIAGGAHRITSESKIVSNNSKITR